ncbi:MAG: hypothetical protein E6G10_29090 [Actinobacteria bacterium]|nr:MAG: hypothetical protein E6G10_29090 [Actinomycetota bacterium]
MIDGNDVGFVQQPGERVARPARGEPGEEGGEAVAGRPPHGRLELLRGIRVRGDGDPAQPIAPGARERVGDEPGLAHDLRQTASGTYHRFLLVRAERTGAFEDPQVAVDPTAGAQRRAGPRLHAERLVDGDAGQAGGAVEVERPQPGRDLRRGLPLQDRREPDRVRGRVLRAVGEQPEPMVLDRHGAADVISERVDDVLEARQALGSTASGERRQPAIDGTILVLIGPRVPACICRMDSEDPRR